MDNFLKITAASTGEEFWLNTEDIILIQSSRTGSVIHMLNSITCETSLKPTELMDAIKQIKEGNK